MRQLPNTKLAQAKQILHQLNLQHKFLRPGLTVVDLVSPLRFCILVEAEKFIADNRSRDMHRVLGQLYLLSSRPGPRCRG